MAAAVTDTTLKKKKKSIFGSLFHRKKNKKKEKPYATAYMYVDNTTGVSSNPTQIQRHVTSAGSDVIQLTRDQSASSKKQPAIHDAQPSHVPDDVRANGGLAACSRSSSRSSGFDEISSAVTECSLLPVAQAHAQYDIAEVNDDVSNMAAEDDHVCVNSDEGRQGNIGDIDANSSGTLRAASTDSNDITDNDKTAQPAPAANSCSSQGDNDTAECEQKLQELSRQIELMNQRFNKMVTRVKASQVTPELTQSSASLNRVDQDQEGQGWNTGSLWNVRQSPGTAADSRYSRNSAYRRLLETGTHKPATNRNVNKRQPITVPGRVATTTADAPASHVTPYSIPIGQNGEGDGPVADVQNESVPSVQFDDVIAENVTSEVGETEKAEVEMYSGGPQSTVNGNHLGAGVPDVESASPGKSELQEGSRQEEKSEDGSEDVKEKVVFEDEGSLMSEAAQSVDNISATDDQCSVATISDVGATAGQSLGHPRSLSGQFSDVFLEDETAKSWSRAGMWTRTGLAWTPGCRLYSSPDPSQGQPRSQRLEQSADGSRPSRPSAAGRTLSYDSSSTRRLRPTASCDAVPRLINRRRSLLEQSAEVKGQFARWHQQLNASGSTSPGKVSPLKALPVQAASSTLQRPVSAAGPALVSNADDVSPVQQDAMSSDMTSSGSETAVWRSRDYSSTSLLTDVSDAPRRPLRRLYRSDSLPVGGSTEAARAKEAMVDRHFAIPRTAMARFNDDGTPKSILKKTSSYATDLNEC